MKWEECPLHPKAKDVGIKAIELCRWMVVKDGNLLHHGVCLKSSCPLVQMGKEIKACMTLIEELKNRG